MGLVLDTLDLDDVPSKRRTALISAIAELASDAEVIHLRTRRQVRSFLEGVQKPG